jgi:hypothetical protein
MVDYWVQTPEGGRDSASDGTLLLNTYHGLELFFVQRGNK